MKELFRKLPWGLRERPFDVYAALILFLGGIYILIDPGFPEYSGHIFDSSVITAISIYLIISSFLILTALFKDRKKCPAYTIFAEMYGWLFVASATLALTLFYMYSMIWDNANRPIIYWSIWFCIYFFMFIAASFRYFDLRDKYLEIKK